MLGPDAAGLGRRRYVRAIWPRLRKVLRNDEEVELLVAELRLVAEKAFESDDRSLSSSLPDSSDLPTPSTDRDTAWAVDDLVHV